MSQPIVEAAFLNVVATPHPPGVYERLLRRASRTPVAYRGNYHAAISAPVKARDRSGFLVFTLFVWTEVNPNEPAINKTDMEKAAFPIEGRDFTSRYGVNGKSFACVFDPSIHLLTAEIRNEDGKTLSIDMLRRIFNELLSAKILGTNAEEVEVTVVPTDGAIEYVLSIERLDRVEIFLKRPNPDDLTSETNRVLQDLASQNVKSERIILARQAKTPGIELGEDNLRRARVGAKNGFVDTTGVDADGEHVRRSTKEVPRVVRQVVAAGASFVAAVRSIAREARSQHEQL